MNDEKDLLTIGEVARRSGMRTSALRYYESVGLLPDPRRVGGGHRRYDPSVLDIISVLRIAQQAGFTIAEMHLLVAGFDPETPASERWQQLAQRKLQEVEEVIAHAQQTKLILEQLIQCGCVRLEECAENCAPQNLIGIERKHTGATHEQ
jgi:MerR family transcriptional regulator, redox-sensitive transcriptional activator SoxR